MKRFICLTLGVVAACSASGFSLWGPAETWQTQDLDYGIRYLPYFPAPNLIENGVTGLAIPENVELGGTKNISEGARLNVPIITYGFDYTFLSYFGAQGVAAVDSAFAVLNGLPSASSANLKTFITQGNQQINYSAAAMRMLDIKSTVLWLMMEHMGLIGETHTYDLNERQAVIGSTATCDFYYVVLQRNFDPTTYDPSSYVNGTLLTYQIGDLCPTLQVGDAMEKAVQAGSPPFSAVATREALQVGGYYLRITRDDMGGLRYLYRRNRYVNEGFDINTTFTTTSGTYNPISLIASNGTGVGGTFSALVGGVEKITFVKTAYDSELGTYFAPITYHYSIPWVTNGVLQSLSVTRVVTAPDILFTAGNLTEPGPNPYQETLVRSMNAPIIYGEAPQLGVGSVSPAVLPPELIVTFNNSGQVYYNESSTYADQASSVELGFIWASFNGSTNAPVVFPTGTSLAEIESQVLSAGSETELNTYVPVSLLAPTTNAAATTTGTP
ncbi:MAG: hypothetical protein ACLQU4_05270 [Limisphaerales bacterium]